jgi:GTP-binding protein
VRTGEVKLLVLLTKADKLTKSESVAAVAAASTVLGEFSTEDSDIGVTLFSSLRRIGVDDAAEQLLAWKKAMPEHVHFDLPPMPAEGAADGVDEDADADADDPA